MTNFRNLDSAPLIGFDGWMIDRSVFTEIPPPWSFSVDEGDFDEDLIKSKLIEQGYQKVECGSGEYYSIRGDYDIDPSSQLVMMGAMASLNRIAVLDNTLVTTVATADMTDILDAISGRGISVARARRNQRRQTGDARRAGQRRGNLGRLPLRCRFPSVERR